MLKTWKTFDFSDALGEADVHVILLDVNDFMGQLSAYQLFLNEEELIKNQHAHFIIARGILRQLLAYYLKCHPKELVFEYEKKGKPSLKNNDLLFNLSHAHQKIIYVFSKKRKVGVDVEFKKREVNFLKIAERFFSLSESQYLKNLPSAQLLDMFYRLWTYKEAYVKALGQGISSFQDFSIDVKKNPLDINHFRLSEFFFAEEYQAAVAIEKNIPCNILFFKLNQDL
ncbi:MAG: hypothetical protein A2W47_03565 [Gammaproteobacteria bacterium RIFCSPHIGHO2_12_38_15]|nr:MAG: hypothetical protein A2W47_03565 [Gammaproteobacteria bacterium RIFCSPHIGHO2_12_38_15]